MSSGSELVGRGFGVAERRESPRLAAFLVCVLAGLASGCRDVGQPAVEAAPAAPRALVGPLPGFGERPAEEPNPFAGDPEGRLQGLRFFRAYNCAGCHGEHGGGGMGPSLRDDIWLYGNSDAQIASSILDGRAYGMPAWRAMLTPTQVWQIAAYIKSFRTSHEPLPPG
jgi:cytochrome c oxidase cbb3-type subunit 3